MRIKNSNKGDLMPEKSWIQNAVIYQIYPLTFNYKAGSESDPFHGAYGNLKGITEKADYIKSMSSCRIA